jgi:hypothetical protein
MGRKRRSLIGSKFSNRAKYSAIGQSEKMEESNANIDNIVDIEASLSADNTEASSVNIPIVPLSPIITQPIENIEVSSEIIDPVTIIEPEPAKKIEKVAKPTPTSRKPKSTKTKSVRTASKERTRATVKKKSTTRKKTVRKEG